MSYVQHPASLLVEAKRLATDGHSFREIGRRLGVHPQTAQRWTDPDYNERFLPANAERKRAWRARRRYVPGMRIAQSTAAKIAALYEQGCSYEAIAAAVRVYEGRKIGAASVHKLLREHYPNFRPRTRGNAFGSPEHRGTGRTA